MFLDAVERKTDSRLVITIKGKLHKSLVLRSRGVRLQNVKEKLCIGLFGGD